MTPTLRTGGIAAILLSALAATATFAAVPYSETWSAGDTNGWGQGTIDTTVIRDASFGNPPGSLALRRQLGQPPVFDLAANSDLPALSGDFTGEPQWMINFGAYYFTGAFTDARLRFRYDDAAKNGWYLSVGNAFPQAWQTYSVMFDPNWSDAEASAAGWIQEPTSASWATMMSDVYVTEVRLILGDDASALAHVDNFILKAIPEPTIACSMFALGALALAHRRRGRR